MTNTATREAFKAWLRERGDPAIAFTDGPLRDAAYAVLEWEGKI